MPSYQEMTLENQMQVFSYSLPHLHSIEAALYFKAGSLYEQGDCYGISHLLQHMCLRNLNGIEKKELISRLDAIGASLEGHVFPEAIVFSMRFSPQFFDKAMEIFGQFFAGGTWSEKEIADEKAIVLRQLENEDPDFWLDIREHYWRTEPQPHSLRGSIPSVKEITSAQLHNFKKEVLHPGNSSFVLTGNFSKGMLHTAYELFNQWSGKGPSTFEQPLPFNFGYRDEKNDVYIENHGHKGHVHLSFDINDELLFPICVDVLNTIVGEGPGSALYVSLRDRLALTDEVRSTIEEIGAFRRFVIEFSLPNSQLLEGIEATFQEIYKLTQHISSRKINRTKIYFEDNASFLIDDVSKVNRRLGWGFLSQRIEEVDPETRQQMYRDVSSEDLLEAAQTVFRRENLCCYLSYNPAILSKEAIIQKTATLRDLLS